MSLRKLWCALLVGFAVGAAALPAIAFARDPILFVHGWSGEGGNWSYFAGRFLLDGYGSSLLDLWSYDWTKSNRSIAQDVANEVAALRARTGAARVDIVSHSMGGLNSRYYLKNLGGTANVDDGSRSAGRTTARTSPTSARRSRPRATTCSTARRS